MSRPKAIPHPGTSVTALRESVLTMKEHIEVLTNVRGELLDKAVTLQDLLTLGLIQESDLALIRMFERKTYDHT